MLFFCVVGEPTLLYNIGGFLVAKANAGHTGIAGGLFVTMIQKNLLPFIPKADFNSIIETDKKSY